MCNIQLCFLTSKNKLTKFGGRLYWVSGWIGFCLGAGGHGWRFVLVVVEVDLVEGCVSVALKHVQLVVVVAVLDGGGRVQNTRNVDVNLFVAYYSKYFIHLIL